MGMKMLTNLAGTIRGSLPVNFFFDPKSEKNGNMLAILAVMGYTVAD